MKLKDRVEELERQVRELQSRPTLPSHGQQPYYMRPFLPHAPPQIYPDVVPPHWPVITCNGTYYKNPAPDASPSPVPSGLFGMATIGCDKYHS